MDSRPHGRDQVRAAIITAARARFAREGLSASLRDIAKDANVNLGLLHRHFGSKDALISAVLSDVAERGSARFADIETLGQAIDVMIGAPRSGSDAYPRMVAWMLLSGEDPHQFQHQFPTIAHLVDIAGPERRELVLLTLVATFGWQIFARHLTTAVGYESEEAAGAALAQLLRRIAGSFDAAPESDGAARP